MAFFVLFTSTFSFCIVPTYAFFAEVGVASSVIQSVIGGLGLYGTGKGDREKVANDFISWGFKNLADFDDKISNIEFKAGAVVVTRALFIYLSNAFISYLNEKQAINDDEISIIYNDVADFSYSELDSYMTSFLNDFVKSNYGLSSYSFYNYKIVPANFNDCAYIDIYDLSYTSSIESHAFYFIGRPYKQLPNSFRVYNSWLQYSNKVIVGGDGGISLLTSDGIKDFSSFYFPDRVSTSNVVLSNGEEPNFTTVEDFVAYLSYCYSSSFTNPSVVYNGYEKIATLYNPEIIDLASKLYSESQSIIKNTYNTNQIFNQYSSTYVDDAGELEGDLLTLGAQVNSLGEVVGELSDTLKSSQILGQELDITDVEIPTEITSSAIVSPEVTGFLGSFWSLFVQHLSTLFSWESGLFMPLSKPLSYLEKLVDISNWGQEEGILSKLLNIGVSNSNLFSKLANISDWSLDIGLLENLVPISANIEGLLQFPEQIYGKFQGTLQGLQQGVTNTYELIQSFDLKLILNDFFVPSSDDFVGPCKSFAESHFSSTFLSFHEYTIPDVVGEINGKRVIFMDNRFIRDNILVIRGWLQGAFILAYILHWCFIVYKIFGKANSKFANDLMKSTGDID